MKSLILRGFKTFADQTELEFSPDVRITAIVGPNGCGKSNLMDAARWVLGEDNSRELRVATLSDIIFAGSTQRKALSLGEVTLLFDNTDGALPVPFTEVAVKRRTFREGESEFFINKNQCRLKDIKDLLLDTGLGEATYSIITQGRVDAILGSRGEERRAVFEEAAGINKYKTRKYAAEKKLIGAEQNILRISDIKVEISEHIITLEEQSRIAQRYIEVQNRAKELDLGLSRKIISQLLEKQQKLSRDLVRVKQAAQAQEADDETDQNELSALKQAQYKLEQDIDQIIVRREAEKDRLRDLELDRRFTAGEQQREAKALTELSDREIGLQQKISALKLQLEKEQAGLDLGDSPFSSSLSALVEQTKILTEQLSNLLAGFGKENALTLTLGHSQEKEETYKMKLEMLEEEARRLTKEKERLDFALQAHLVQLKNLDQRLAAVQPPAGAIDALAVKRQEKEALSSRLAVLEQKIRLADQQERQSLSEEANIEIALAKIEGELSGIAERLSLDYNITIPELEALPYEISNTQTAKREIDECRAKLRALEPVNLLAIEEFAKEKERLSFIEAQLADLNASRDNLRNLIGELDLKAEQTFLETMNKLSIVFSETFSKLFNGGEAKISLAADQPVLEAEIEISVRPAGRKWLPLPLLSGGERSLSAIAILFSLLKIRPSPFCFMDEVDAALDDANIGRFTEMLQDFSRQSQILVISHNKRTMAVANNIYGVTMEEPGVSKIISMKLAETAVA
ncbi:AAA family ATPase [Candidatus Saganbacteria bacterium]|nr:AAA family ATPase [Candidatus Saganbacteria bacterium]